LSTAYGCSIHAVFADAINLRICGQHLTGKIIPALWICAAQASYTKPALVFVSYSSIKNMKT
jgi:hypothetical protein